MPVICVHACHVLLQLLILFLIILLLLKLALQWLLLILLHHCVCSPTWVDVPLDFLMMGVLGSRSRDWAKSGCSCSTWRDSFTPLLQREEGERFKNGRQREDAREIGKREADPERHLRCGKHKGGKWEWVNGETNREETWGKQGEVESWRKRVTFLKVTKKGSTKKSNYIDIHIYIHCTYIYFFILSEKRVEIHVFQHIWHVFQHKKLLKQYFDKSL